MTKEKIIDRLQKLQAKADSAAEIGNEAEAMTFAEKVKELLAKHKLDMSVLTITEHNERDPLGEHDVDIDDKKRRTPGWILILADAVARAYYCRILSWSGMNRVCIVGRQTDREITEYVLMRLVYFINEEGKRQHNALRYRLWKTKGHMTEAHGFMDSFRAAAVKRIKTRLEQLRKQEAASSSMALVVRRSDEEVDALHASLSKGETKAVVRTSLNIHGLRAGESTGDRADITGTGLRPGRGRGSLPAGA